MQTRKKVSRRNYSQEPVSPRFSRQQKKTSENLHVPEKKATELITSSARKPKLCTRSKKNGEQISAAELNSRYRLEDDDASSVCLGHGNYPDTCNASMCQEGIAHHMLETIFSPPFHTSNDGVDTANRDQQFQDHEIENLQVDAISAHVMEETKIFNEDTMDVNNSTCADVGAHCMTSEVSVIYQSMKNAKLECVDERSHKSSDNCIEEDEDFDEFDPYFFIKSLPALSSVVPTFRPLLLPKQTRSCPPTSLVLDLDETLVHSMLEPCDDADFTFSVNFNLKEHMVFVRCRPHLKDFMERVSGLFEITIFTASQSIYAEQLLNVLDPKRKVFRHRVYRESCVFVEGNYLKDLSVLGRDLAHVVIIDNSPQAFGFQVDNGIPIESWFDDRSDKELLLLLPFLESLVGVDDVRPLIAKKFNLREKIAAAICPLNSGGDPLVR